MVPLHLRPELALGLPREVSLAWTLCPIKGGTMVLYH